MNLFLQRRQDALHVFLVLFREFIRLFFYFISEILKLLGKFILKFFYFVFLFPVAFHRFSKSTSFLKLDGQAVLFVADGFFSIMLFSGFQNSFIIQELFFQLIELKEKAISFLRFIFSEKEQKNELPMKHNG
jgi:hypothetical protein